MFGNLGTTTGYVGFAGATCAGVAGNQPGNGVTVGGLVRGVAGLAWWNGNMAVPAAASNSTHPSIPVIPHSLPTPHNQVGGTCYAHAVASVINHSESRIIGRQYDDHWGKAKILINKFGTDGANTKKALAWMCNQRKLRYQEVSLDEAVKIIGRGRPICCRFYFTGVQWDKFSCFYRQKSNACLDNINTLNDVNTDDIVKPSDAGGHAVVIIGMNESRRYFKIKNSWGGNFGDKGYFKMGFDLFNNLDANFFDVFWYENDLTEEEKSKWNNMSLEEQNAFKNQLQFTPPAQN